MAIILPQGFRITSQDPIDSRLLLSKSEMLDVVDAQMPSKYLAVCKDDGKIYVYNVNNTVDPETGKFRLYAEGGGGTGLVNDVKVDGVSVVTDKIANINLATPLSLKQDKLTAGTGIKIEDNVISVTGGGGTTSWGNITGTLSNQTDLQSELDKKLEYQEGDTLILNCNL